MLLPHPPTVPPFPPHASATPTYCPHLLPHPPTVPPSPTACFCHTHLLSPLPHRMLLPHPLHASATPTACFCHTHLLLGGLCSTQPFSPFSFFIACSFKNGRRRPGSFYHLNNINAYLGRQGGGGVPIERTILRPLLVVFVPSARDLNACKAKKQIALCSEQKTHTQNVSF